MSAGRGSRSALQEDPQSPFAEILVRAPEKPEIHPPSPLCPDLSETRGSAECHWRAHVAVPAPVPSSGRYRLFQTLFTARGSLGSWLQERVRRAAGCAEGLREPVRRLPLFGRRYLLEDHGSWFLAEKGKTYSSGWKLDPESRNTFLSKEWCFLTTSFPGRGAVHFSCSSLVWPCQCQRGSRGHPPAHCLGSGCWLSHLFLVDPSCCAYSRT
ncbi:uncharacterized protein LOC119151095 isoform X2 [Falco rusticolus]|uniref:uncharacterized protein LOC119151095 isoform X2 n=1 Tax=Falco rusticolus TaxID=120794 RepID=UPI000FFB57D9|nr:uncharacterized protein LOC119151095 isoform X2 [Falco rusticolus]